MWWEFWLIILGIAILSVNTLLFPYSRRSLNSNMATTDLPFRMASDADQLRDIYHTAFLLRQKLVPDVVPAILRYAGLLQRHVYSAGPRTDNRHLIVTQNSAPKRTLITPPIQSSARLQNPVHKVVFSIQSSDQGWASNRDAGSWTWFTAGVYPKNQPEDEEPADDEAARVERDDRFLPREREIFRNDVASSEMKLHIVEWSADSKNADERKWVETLENGDRIAVRAWAQFSGWQNKIKSVSVAIYTAAVI